MKTEKTDASKSKTVLFFINVTVFIAMIIHVAIKTDLHLQHPPIHPQTSTSPRRKSRLLKNKEEVDIPEKI